jgi:hypothetical protein
MNKMTYRKQPSDLDRGTLIASPSGKSAGSTMADLISQTRNTEEARSLALALVGTALCIKDPHTSRPLAGDETVEFLGSQSSGDFRIHNCVFLVELGLPSEEHFEKIQVILKQRNIEIWLLTSEDRVASWKNEVSNLFGKRVARIVVTSVESFVGQNITELAGFSSAAKIERITELVDLYNHKWVDAVGAPSIRISIE